MRRPVAELGLQLGEVTEQLGIAGLELDRRGEVAGGEVEAAVIARVAGLALQRGGAAARGGADRRGDRGRRGAGGLAGAGERLGGGAQLGVVRGDLARRVDGGAGPAEPRRSPADLDRIAGARLGDQGAERGGGGGAGRGHRRGLLVLVAGHGAGEPLVQGRGLGALGAAARLIGDEAEGGAIVGIDLERAAVRLERDLGPVELELERGEPGEQRLLPAGPARRRGDLAPEDHRDPLEVAERALDHLERVEGGQVVLDQAQRALEAARRVVEVLGRGGRGAPVQLGGAVPRVGAVRRGRAGGRIAGEGLEAARREQDVAGALAQVGEQLVGERAQVARRLIVGEHRLELGARPRRIAELLGGDREPVAQVRRPLGHRLGGADQIRPGALPPRRLGGGVEDAAAQVGGQLGAVGAGDQ